MVKRTIPEVEKLSEESHQLYDFLNEESDLACVLISASYLEFSLAALLKRHLVEDIVADDFINRSSLRRRADLAYSVGLIPQALHANLHVIADIRNSFAHNYLMLNLSEGRFPQLIDSLRPPTIHQTIKLDEFNNRSVLGPQPMELVGSYRDSLIRSLV